MEIVESTKKAALWNQEGVRFIVTIGRGKKKPHEDDEIPFRRDSKGLLVLKESSWRYPYNEDNKAAMLEHAKHLYNIHC